MTPGQSVSRALEQFNAVKKEGTRMSSGSGGGGGAGRGTGAGAGTGSGSVVSISSRRMKMGRPPKGGRSPQQLVDISKSSTPEGIWSYFSSSERDHLRSRQLHPEDFHVSVSDDNGHDIKKQVRFHPMMMNELAMFVARGNFPVESVDDLIRSGTFWFMGLLYALEKKVNPGVPNPLPMIAAINRLSMSVYYSTAFDATYENVKAQAIKLIQTGRERQAAVFIYDVMEQVKQIPQKAYREPALERIRNDFGDLIRKNMKSVKVLKRGKKGSEQRRKYIGGGEDE